MRNLSKLFWIDFLFYRKNILKKCDIFYTMICTILIIILNKENKKALILSMLFCLRFVLV